MIKHELEKILHDIRNGAVPKVNFEELETRALVAYVKEEMSQEDMSLETTLETVLEAMKTKSTVESSFHVHESYFETLNQLGINSVLLESMKKWFDIKEDIGTSELGLSYIQENHTSLSDETIFKILLANPLIYNYVFEGTPGIQLHSAFDELSKYI